MAYIAKEDGSREEIESLTDRKVLEILGLDNVRNVRYEDSSETPFRMLWSDNEPHEPINKHVKELFGYYRPVRGPIIVLSLDAESTYWS